MTLLTQLLMQLLTQLLTHTVLLAAVSADPLGSGRVRPKFSCVGSAPDGAKRPPHFSKTAGTKQPPRFSKTADESTKAAATIIVTTTTTTTGGYKPLY